jgi:hypothetical protein
MSQLPSPLRAAIGLAAEAADQARNLPATLPGKALELPMLAVSTALQLSMRAQQRYAMLAARGEDILNHREPTDEPPSWATFDDPVDDDEPVGEGPDEAPVGEEPVDAAGEPVNDDGTTRFPGKGVQPPRHGAPSRFDTVSDEAVGDDTTDDD